MNQVNQKQSRWVNEDEFLQVNRGGFSILNFFASIAFLGVLISIVLPELL